jgi:hypothetical protein
MEITISIPDVFVSRARSEGLPAEAYVERLLGEIAAASEAQSRNRDLLRDELLADWEHYQTTGLHLDEDEVDTWLGGMENGLKGEPPELHL